jgi:hypothetical protein
MRWAGNLTRIRVKRNAYRILVGKQDENKLLGKPRRSCGNNIKIDLRRVGWVVWTQFIWLRRGISGWLL